MTIGSFAVSCGSLLLTVGLCVFLVDTSVNNCLSSSLLREFWKRI